MCYSIVFFIHLLFFNVCHIDWATFDLEVAYLKWYYARYSILSWKFLASIASSKIARCSRGDVRW